MNLGEVNFLSERQEIRTEFCTFPVACSINTQPLPLVDTPNSCVPH